MAKITITQVRNAKSLDENNSRIDVEINHPVYGWIPYTVDQNDQDKTISNSDILFLIGSNFEAYVPPTQQELDEQEAFLVRQRRDEILTTEVDPIVSNPLRWAEMTPDEQQAWSDYRRALLDITLQSGFPHDINWPIAP